MRAQELPIRLMIIAGLGILTLIAGAAIFVIGMRGFPQQTRIVNLTQAECQNVCATISVSANNYYICELLKTTPSGTKYSSDCSDYGSCRVSLGNGVQCSIP